MPLPLLENFIGLSVQSCPIRMIMWKVLPSLEILKLNLQMRSHSYSHICVEWIVTGVLKDLFHLLIHSQPYSNGSAKMFFTPGKLHFAYLSIAQF